MFVYFAWILFAGRNRWSARLRTRPASIIQTNILHLHRCHLQIFTAHYADRAQLLSHHDRAEIASDAKHHDKHAAGKTIAHTHAPASLSCSTHALTLNAVPLQAQSDSAQENKVTITLIAVVILFLLCQTPSAIQLLWTIDYDKGDHKPPNLILGKFTKRIRRPDRMAIKTLIFEIPCCAPPLQP